MRLLGSIFIFSLSFQAMAEAKKVAVVKLLRGEVSVLNLGKTEKLNLEDWISEGSVIKTEDKSFARIIFTDKSQMNIGPNSEMKVEKFTDEDAGVIDLVKGQIRSQVTKDYLQIKDKEKSKLFIKTPNAVMGVRGTDFMISTNGKNTSTVLFSGEIVFNRLDQRNLINTDRLESIVDRGVRVFPGEFSVVDQSRGTPTVPAILNVQQREALEKNETFDQRAPNSSASSEETKKSIVPSGLNAKVIANDSSVLGDEVKQITGQTNQANDNAASKSASDGFISGNQIKPANGSVLHLQSGIIIPPSSDSVLDKNTNTYTAGSDVQIDASGNIQLKNKEITSDGMILSVVTTPDGRKEVVTAAPPVPVATTSGEASSSISSSTSGSSNLSANQDIVQNPNGLGTTVQQQPSTGGVQTVNDATQQMGSGAQRTRTIITN